MNTTIETLDTMVLPFMEITPTIWRSDDMCGIANIHTKMHVGPIGWIIANIISQACE